MDNLACRIGSNDRRIAPYCRRHKHSVCPVLRYPPWRPQEILLRSSVCVCTIVIGLYQESSSNQLGPLFLFGTDDVTGRTVTMTGTRISTPLSQHCRSLLFELTALDEAKVLFEAVRDTIGPHVRLADDYSVKDQRIVTSEDKLMLLHLPAG